MGYWLHKYAPRPDILIHWHFMCSIFPRLYFGMGYDACGIDTGLNRINPVLECGYIFGTTSSICVDVLAMSFLGQKGK